MELRADFLRSVRGDSVNEVKMYVMAVKRTEAVCRCMQSVPIKKRKSRRMKTEVCAANTMIGKKIVVNCY